jgi:hypothetical protein
MLISLALMISRLDFQSVNVAADAVGEHRFSWSIPDIIGKYVSKYHPNIISVAQENVFLFQSSAKMAGSLTNETESDYHSLHNTILFCLRLSDTIRQLHSN